MTPQLVLFRRWFTDTTTVGELHIDGMHKCLILEDKYRDLSVEEKVPGETCIPYGTYEIILSYSNRFKAHMPLLIGVEHFDGIRIHPGNVAADTDGCLLPGISQTPDHLAVEYSRTAYQNIYMILRSMIEHEKVFIEIRKGELV